MTGNMNNRSSVTLRLLTCIILVILGCLPIEGKTRDRVKLKDIKVLTLHHGQMTTGRRTRPLPQLICIGGTNRCKYLPPVIQCYNRGSDGVDIQWECKADMDVNLRFNKIDVTCEGYDYPEDDYVLAGSCALEYSIDSVDGQLHPKTEYRFNQPPPRRHHEYAGNTAGNQQRSKPYKEPSFQVVVILAIIAGVMYLIWKNCIEVEQRNQRPEQPPPYPGHASAPPYPGKTGHETSPPPAGFKEEFTKTSQQQTSDGTSRQQTTDTSERGFWSGLGLGSLGGYFFRSQGYNSRRPTVIPPQTNDDDEEEYYRRNSRDTSWSSWFGPSSSSSSTRRRRRPSPPPEPTSYRPSSPSTTSSSSTGSKTASGFGGTSRR